MVLSHLYKLWFFHIPKTGGSAISHVLRRHLDKTTLHNSPGVFSSNTHVKYCDCYQTYTQYLHYYKFTFVRNPWVRLFSCFTAKHVYNKSAVTQKSFTFFVKHLQQDIFARHTQWSYIQQKNKSSMNFVGKTEHLQDGFNHVLQQISVPSVIIPRVNVSNIQWDYKKFYTSETQRIVKEYYRDDIENFEYDYV